jgi:hypothetical protein
LRPTKPQSLKQLQKIWYAKLAKKGFKDAEQDPDNLKRWSGHFRTWYDDQSYEDKERYFQLAGQFLHDYEFSSYREKLIWQCHSEGMTLHETIAFVKRKGRKCYMDVVRNTVKKLARIMLQNET